MLKVGVVDGGGARTGCVEEAHQRSGRDDERTLAPLMSERHCDSISRITAHASASSSS